MKIMTTLHGIFAKILGHSPQQSAQDIDDSTPRAMIILTRAVDGEYDTTTCVLQGKDYQLFAVAGGTGAKMTNEAMAIAGREGVSTLCAYRVDEAVTVTYHRNADGNWSRVVAENGSVGIARLKKRAARYLEGLQSLAAHSQVA